MNSNTNEVGKLPAINDKTLVVVSTGPREEASVFKLTDLAEQAKLTLNDLALRLASGAEVAVNLSRNCVPLFRANGLGEIRAKLLRPQFRGHELVGLAAIAEAEIGNQEQEGKMMQTAQAKRYASNKEPFDIPAINSEKLALMRYLKLNGEDDADYGKVSELEGFKLDCKEGSSTSAVSVFEYNNERYHVAHATAELEADALQEFNSNWWRIRKVERAQT